MTPVDGAWRLTADLDTLVSSVPITARELIQKRLASLSFDERQTLETASALGAEFTTAQVAALLDGDRDVQERRCAALVGRYGLLREAGLSLGAGPFPAVPNGIRGSPVGAVMDADGLRDWVKFFQTSG